MSIYEASITNPKKQLEFYKQLSEQLLQENQKLKADYGTKVQVERDMLQQENKILKENAENNDKVNWENMLLKKENQELKEKLDKYENPEDMTLMMMWCTEKAKDKIKELKDNWNKLKEWIKEYIKTNEKWYSSELSNHDKEYYKKDYIDSKFWLMKFQNQMQEIEGGMNI